VGNSRKIARGGSGPPAADHSDGLRDLERRRSSCKRKRRYEIKDALPFGTGMGAGPGKQSDERGEHTAIQQVGAWLEGAPFQSSCNKSAPYTEVALRWFNCLNQQQAGTDLQGGKNPNGSRPRMRAG